MSGLRLSFAFFLLCSCATSVRAQKGLQGVGFLADGLGYRCYVSDRVSLDVRGYYEHGSSGSLAVLGGRGSWHFPSVLGFRPYAGAGSDHISFARGSSAGSGWSARVFAGGERFLSRRLSLCVDLGPARTFLRDRKYRTRSASTDLLLDAGVVWHFR